MISSPRVRRGRAASSSLTVCGLPSQPRQVIFRLRTKKTAASFKVPGNKRPVDVCQIIKVNENFGSQSKPHFQTELGIDDIPGEDDKKYKDGELYFEVSDVEKNVLTFKQFIHFITKGTSETMSGKVIRDIIIVDGNIA